jgi:hypothetical protein
MESRCRHNPLYSFVLSSRGFLSQYPFDLNPIHLNSNKVGRLWAAVVKLHILAIHYLYRRFKNFHTSRTDQYSHSHNRDIGGSTDVR